MTLSITADHYYAECHYAECRYAECYYAECCYAECHYAECRYAECHYVECCFAECRGAAKIAISMEKNQLEQDYHGNLTEGKGSVQLISLY